MAASSSSRLRPLSGQIGVAADDQAFAWIVRGGDLGQVPLVEQRKLQRAGLGEGLDLRRAQRGDPVEPGGLEVLADPRRGDHAPVADQHQVLEAKAALQRLDLARHYARVAGIAFEHLDGNRPSIAIAEQAVDDLQPIRAAVAAVAVPDELAAPAFQIGRADVVEHQRSVPEMPPCQGALDAILLAAEPVERGVDLALFDRTQIEHPAEARAGRRVAQCPRVASLEPGATRRLAISANARSRSRESYGRTWVTTV